MPGSQAIGVIFLSLMPAVLPTRSLMHATHWFLSSARPISADAVAA